MRDLLAGTRGERLDLSAYRADFTHQFWQTSEPGFWKLERQQYFQEPGDDSWEAFARGDWHEALRRLTAMRPRLEAEHRSIVQHGFVVRRVRVVEEPLTPYLQWELHVLRLREECGSRVRIVDTKHVTPHEKAEPLPEMCTIGTAVMYEVLYSKEGVLDGAVKYTDPSLIGQCQQLIARLYQVGEPLADYFRRSVADLPAPVSRGSC